MTESSKLFDVQRMVDGKLYRAVEELEAHQVKPRALVREFNTSIDEVRKDEILTELLGSRGKNCTLTAPIGFDYGWNMHVGENFYANMDLIVLDVCEVRIGDNCFIGPRVSLLTATHPIDPGVRADELEYGVPITIGNNVWIGGGAIINHGVTIGDNTVIGSGSVVTKDIPAGVVAAGSPCRVLREVTEEDTRLWQARAAEYWEADRSARP